MTNASMTQPIRYRLDRDEGNAMSRLAGLFWLAAVLALAGCHQVAMPASPAPTATPATEPAQTVTPAPIPSPTAAPAQTTGWRRLTVTAEYRCSPYDPDDYSHPQSVESRIVADMGGIVYGPYSGRMFDSARETDIEHTVARSEAHDSGLCAADAPTRKRFSSGPAQPHSGRAER